MTVFSPVMDSLRRIHSSSFWTRSHAVATPDLTRAGPERHPMPHTSEMAVFLRSSASISGGTNRAPVVCLHASSPAFASVLVRATAMATGMPVHWTIVFLSWSHHAWSASSTVKNDSSMEYCCTDPTNSFNAAMTQSETLWYSG
jgi:hypothetical protein